MNDMHIMARILAAVRANEGNLVFNTSLVDEKVIKTDAKTVERCTIFSGSFKYTALPCVYECHTRQILRTQH